MKKIQKNLRRLFRALYFHILMTSFFHIYKKSKKNIYIYLYLYVAYYVYFFIYKYISL